MTEIFERMRGLYTPVTDLRRKTFSSVALFALAGGGRDLFDRLPFEIIDTSQKAQYRCCTFREIVVLQQRLRLAMGLSPISELHQPTTDGIEQAFTDHRIIELPLVHVIQAACERCPQDEVVVTDMCKRCIAHPCSVVCPKNAVTFTKNHAVINLEKCIRCGKCIQACPYQAITRLQRPCAQACGVDAIYTDSQGYTAIDHTRCVSCGLCVVSCPFGAISDKSEIVQVLLALRKPENQGKVYAILAPSFVGQFGRLVSPELFAQGLLQLGFAKVMEVAFGADLDTLEIIPRLLEICKTEQKRITTKEPGSPERDFNFVGTSCCTAWVATTHKFFPEMSGNIANSYPPMVETAKEIKKGHPDAKVVFIGPCIAKKEESLREPVRQWVDYVLTFEELAAMYVATQTDLTQLKQQLPLSDSSTLGRGYAVAGGVAAAIVETAQARYGLGEVAVQRAETLRSCQKMLSDISSGKIKPNLVEGMACPGGCIGGPGTLLPLRNAAREVQKFAAAAKSRFPK
jgi:[FeFe] hydrogenase (group B1/B3)